MAWLRVNELFAIVVLQGAAINRLIEFDLVLYGCVAALEALPETVRGINQSLSD